jgi:NAD(P)-dependent dehydrogenase (short-subunit alcohol dehydrogenase family)
MSNLSGRTALVTGCARSNGLGRSIAIALASVGADVVVSDISTAGTRNRNEAGHDDGEWRGLDSVVDELRAIGSRSLGLVGDVGERADAERMVDEVLAQYSRIDILVNNAGAPVGSDRNLIWEVPEEAFDLVMRVNTKGVFLMSAAVSRHFVARPGGGRIVNISSGAGRKGFAGSGPYCASKFAVIGLTQVLALELAPYGVTVNAICPGPIQTSRTGGLRVDAVPSASAPAFAQIPLGRLGAPNDIAEAVVFLAGDESSFITGQSLNVDGGQQMS